MSKPRALISTFTSVNNEFRKDHMKLCYLWYEEVLFENIGTYDEKRFFDNLLNGESISSKDIKNLTDIILPLEKRVSKELNEENRKLDTRGYPRWGKECENYTYIEPEDSEQYAHNVLLRKIENEFAVKHLDGYDVEHAEGRARVAIDAVRLWEKVNLELECMLQTNEDEKLAMNAMQSFNMFDKKALDPFRLFEVNIPSLSDVAWKDIIRIKNEGRFDSLRNVFSNVVSSNYNNIDDSSAALKKAEETAVSEIIDEYRPNIKKVFLESLLSNIPNIPLVNPISIFLGARDIRTERKKAEHLNWFYLLRDIRKSTNTKSNT